MGPQERVWGIRESASEKVSDGTFESEVGGVLVK